MLFQTLGISLQCRGILETSLARRFHAKPVVSTKKIHPI